jgi:two-component system, chemotaxis family, chemotaxis protein CheY
MSTFDPACTEEIRRERQRNESGAAHGLPDREADMSLRVLLVDDSISTRALIGRTLHDAGHYVAEATDGLQALDALSNGSFDVLVTDQWMPNMTGVELVRAVRAHPVHSQLPILAVTTDAEEDVRDTVIEAGASACILKPFGPDELLDTISRLVEG